MIKLIAQQWANQLRTNIYNKLVRGVLLPLTLISFISCNSIIDNQPEEWIYIGKISQLRNRFYSIKVITKRIWKDSINYHIVTPDSTYDVVYKTSYTFQDTIRAGGTDDFLNGFQFLLEDKHKYFKNSGWIFASKELSLGDSIFIEKNKLSVTDSVTFTDKIRKMKNKYHIFTAF